MKINCELTNNDKSTEFIHLADLCESDTNINVHTHILSKYETFNEANARIIFIIMLAKWHNYVSLAIGISYWR